MYKRQLLLLYDGTIFKMGYTNEEISSIFFDKTATKRFTYNENTDAYEYLLLARLAENGVKFPVQDLMNYCRIRLTRNRMSLSAFATSPDEFYGTEDVYKRQVYAFPVPAALSFQPDH